MAWWWCRWTREGCTPVQRCQCRCMTRAAIMHTHTHTRQYYLSDIPLSEALQKFYDALAPVGALALSEAETLALDQAHGRITAGPVWAARSSPHYDAAAMDGAAVRARETIGATETSPLRLSVGEQAVWVDTGDPMP